MGGSVAPRPRAALPSPVPRPRARLVRGSASAQACAMLRCYPSRSRCFLSRLSWFRVNFAFLPRRCQIGLKKTDICARSGLRLKQARLWAGPPARAAAPKSCSSSSSSLDSRTVQGTSFPHPNTRQPDSRVLRSGCHRRFGRHRCSGRHRGHSCAVWRARRFCSRDSRCKRVRQRPSDVP